MTVGALDYYKTYDSTAATLTEVRDRIKPIEPNERGTLYPHGERLNALVVIQHPPSQCTLTLLGSHTTQTSHCM